MSERPAPLTEPVIFRRIFTGLYVVLLAGFVGTIAFSGTYGAFFAPTAADEVHPDNARADCETRLRKLFEELDARGTAALARAHELDTTESWKTFSDRFRRQLITARERCGAEAPASLERLRLADDLERHRLGYETALRSLTEVAGPSRKRLFEALRPEQSSQAD